MSLQSVGFAFSICVCFSACMAIYVSPCCVVCQADSSYAVALKHCQRVTDLAVATFQVAKYNFSRNCSYTRKIVCFFSILMHRNFQRFPPPQKLNKLFFKRRVKIYDKMYWKYSQKRDTHFLFIAKCCLQISVPVFKSRIEL